MVVEETEGVFGPSLAIDLKTIKWKHILNNSIMDLLLDVIGGVDHPLVVLFEVLVELGRKLVQVLVQEPVLLLVQVVEPILLPRLPPRLATVFVRWLLDLSLVRMSVAHIALKY